MVLFKKSDNDVKVGKQENAVKQEQKSRTRVTQHVRTYRVRACVEESNATVVTPFVASIAFLTCTVSYTNSY